MRVLSEESTQENQELVVGMIERPNVNEIRGKTRHGVLGKFPTRRARVLFTDELPHVASALLIRIVDYELRADVQYVRLSPR